MSRSVLDPQFEQKSLSEAEDVCNIEELASGAFKLSMHVHSAFYGGIIGLKGSTKRRIETETRTEINVPRNREGMKLNENIVIKGKSRESLLAARRQLNILIGSLRARMKPTHFIGIALRGTEVQNKFKEFKREVLTLQLAGINEDLFQDDERIHITLGVCVLLDDLERKKAVDLLQASSELLEDGCNEFNIKVNGLEIMNDDPSSVGVLYACVESPELQQFANRLMAPFEKASLSFDKFEREGVKLHMTLMNKRYGTDNFDARELLKKYGDFDFGTAQCNEVLLCVIKDKKEKGEFYRTTGKLKL